MKCYFCKCEMLERDTLGLWLPIIKCKNHVVPINHYKTSEYGPVEEVYFSLIYPENRQLGGQLIQYLQCVWILIDSSFKMRIFTTELSIGEEIVSLNYLPSDITPENAYQQAERFLKLRVFS